MPLSLQQVLALKNAGTKNHGANGKSKDGTGSKKKPQRALVKQLRLVQIGRMRVWTSKGDGVHR